MHYQHLLKQKKLRSTPARTSVLKVLSTAQEPVDISNIFQKLDGSCDQATVYRTIDTLVKHDLVRQIDFREGKYRYELAGDHHHHLVCKQCGHIEPMYDECLALSDAEIQDKYQFKVAEHHLEFFGTCQKCI